MMIAMSAKETREDDDVPFKANPQAVIVRRLDHSTLHSEGKRERRERGERERRERRERTREKN